MAATAALDAEHNAATISQALGGGTAYSTMLVSDSLGKKTAASRIFETISQLLGTP